MDMTDRNLVINDGLATVDEAAEFLGIGRSWLYAAMERGELCYCKLGRARRIPWAAVRSLAAATLQGGAATSDCPAEEAC